MRREGQKGNVPRLLDGAGQSPLVGGAYPSQPAGHNLAALGHKPLQQPHIPVRDGVDLLGAELAHLLAAEKLSAAARPSAWTTRRTTLPAALSASLPTALPASLPATLRRRAPFGRLALNFICHGDSSSALSH
jgi:hypothetical protein